MEKEMLIDLVNYFADKGYLVGGIKPRADGAYCFDQWVIEITPAPKQAENSGKPGEARC